MERTMTTAQYIKAIKNNFPDRQRYTMLSEALDYALELMEAEERKDIVRLPCKLKDIIYVLKDGELYEDLVWGIKYCITNSYGYTMVIETEGFGDEIPIEDLGKIAFFDESQAEAALKEG